MKLSAIVVSHHDRFRQDLARFAELVDSCIDVVSEVSSSPGALDQVAALRPDVMLLDLGLHDDSALMLIQRIRAQWPETAVILVGHEPDSDYHLVALEAGAIAYVDLLEVGTKLPEALKLIQHPPECDPDRVNPVSVTSRPALVVNLRSRLRTAPTGPKHGPFTTWQYVHVCLAMTVTLMTVSLWLKPNSGFGHVLLLTAVLMNIAVVEARQFARARRAAEILWRGEYLKGGAISKV